MSDQIKDFSDILMNLENKLKNIEKIISEKITQLTNKINCELKETIDLSAEATSYRQYIVDIRTEFYFKLYKEIPKLKQLKKSRYEYYFTKYPIKTNSSEKTKLIESDVAYHEAKMEIYQNHINYLTESLKTVDHVIYSVKNKIELYNATGIS